MNAVANQGGASASAARSELLCELASEHLDYMMAAGKITHDNYSARHNQAAAQGAVKTSEIVASNCGYGNFQAAANQCASSWEKSTSGHRESMHSTWDAMCYQIKSTADGCFYCIGFFANGL